MLKIVNLTLLLILVIPSKSELITPKDVLDFNDKIVNDQECDHSFWFLIDMFNGTSKCFNNQFIKDKIFQHNQLDLGFITLPSLNEIPIVYFAGIAPYEFVPEYPYGFSRKDLDPTPGVPMQEEIKMFYYLKPTYFFMHNQISKYSFCVISIILGDNQEAFEFAEKSLDSGIFLCSNNFYNN